MRTGQKVIVKKKIHVKNILVDKSFCRKENFVETNVWVKLFIQKMSNTKEFLDQNNVGQKLLVQMNFWVNKITEPKVEENSF